MDTSTLRILDASLNRAAEGLRVTEDYARFVLDDAYLSRLAKHLRHDLATVSAVLPYDDLAAARETQRDVGRDGVTLNEFHRRNARDVAIAGLKRAQQALRAIEEYGKLHEDKFAVQVERLRYRSYTLEKALSAVTRSSQRLAETRLYVLIDGRDSPELFEHLVWELVEAGVHALQLRDKNLPDCELVERGRQLVELTRGKCLAIINDRTDVAAAVHANGVHLGQQEMSVKDARTILGPDALIGVSTHSIDQARRAVLDGASYLGAGPTFPSQTKAFDKFTGLDYLRELSAEIGLPAFAIGGIDLGNVAQVQEAGLNRVAVSGAVVNAQSPGKAAKRLIAALSNPAAPADG